MSRTKTTNAPHFCRTHQRVHRKGEAARIPLDVWQRLAHQWIDMQVATAREAGQAEG